MDDSIHADKPRRRLGDISTCWEEVSRAVGGPEHAEKEAQKALLERYRRVIHKYLLGAVRDQEAAGELFQEFVVSLLRGSLRGVDPQGGRFRDYLKATLIHLVNQYRKRKRQRSNKQQIETDLTGVAAADQPEDLDQEFINQWRHDLLEHAWKALAEVQRETRQPVLAVLKFRAQHPKASAAEMAKRLTAKLKPEKAFTDTGIRKVLQRAREKFQELLLVEVACSMRRPTTLDGLEEELIELGLLPYCRAALARRRQRQIPGTLSHLPGSAP